MTELAQAIEDYVKRYDYVTFVELQNRLGDCFNMQGDVEIYILENLLLWSGMSQEFADAIQELQKEKRIYPVSACRLTYMIDGAVVKLPVPKRYPKGGFKKRYWMPICFRHIDTEKQGNEIGKVYG